MWGGRCFRCTSGAVFWASWGGPKDGSLETLWGLTIGVEDSWTETNVLWRGLKQNVNRLNKYTGTRRQMSCVLNIRVRVCAMCVVVVVFCAATRSFLFHLCFSPLSVVRSFSLGGMNAVCAARFVTAHIGQALGRFSNVWRSRINSNVLKSQFLSIISLKFNTHISHSFGILHLWRTDFQVSFSDYLSPFIILSVVFASQSNPNPIIGFLSLAVIGYLHVTSYNPWLSTYNQPVRNEQSFERLGSLPVSDVGDH